MDSAADTPFGGGCPIRRSLDHSLLAAPQGLSQRATSFIASWRQGIHQMPLLSSTPASDNRTVSPTKSATWRGPRTAGTRARDDKQEGTAAPKREQVKRQLRTTSFADRCVARGGVATSIPMPKTPLPADGRKKGKDVDLPAPAAPRAHAGIASRMPARRAPRHHLTMSNEHGPPAPAASLVGLGRLERPTSRLSGVRSNQLSYRPKVRGQSTEIRGQNKTVPRAPALTHGCLRRDVQTAAGVTPRR